MKRSLRRHMEAAINQTYNPRRSDSRGQVAVVLSFPENAFADAPRWNPGPDFTPTAGEYAWLRDNGDGTSTAVVAGVGPKELPGLDGGEWTDPEVWTTTAPNDTIFMNSGAMWDKPHRITWLLRDPRAVVHRELYRTHPSADVHAYWENFDERWGFLPGRMHRGEFPFADRRQFVVLHTKPGYANLPSEVQLLDVAVTLMRTFGAKARVYAYDPQRRNTRDPMGTVSDYTLASMLRCRDRLAARR